MKCMMGDVGGTKWTFAIKCTACDFGRQSQQVWLCEHLLYYSVPLLAFQKMLGKKQIFWLKLSKTSKDTSYIRRHTDGPLVYEKLFYITDHREMLTKVTINIPK